MTQTTLSARAWGELTILALIWGGSFLSIRIALDEIGPLTVVLHRTGWAMFALWAVVFALRIPVTLSRGIVVGFVGMGLLNNVIPFSLMAWGQLFIPSGLTSILNAATAIWGVLVAAVFLGDERLTGRKFLGVSVGFAGVVTTVGWSNLLALDPTALAQWAVLAGTLSYALAGVWARTRLTGVPPLVAAAGMLTGSTVIMIPLVIWAEGVPTLVLSAGTWGAIGYFAVVSTALAYVLYYRVLAVAGSGNLMLVTLMIPPVAIALGAWLRDETLPTNAFAGFGLLAIGLAILDGRVWKRAKRLTPQTR